VTLLPALAYVVFLQASGAGTFTSLGVGHTLLLVGGGRVDDYSGDLDDYARNVQRAGAAAAAVEAPAPLSQNRRDARRDRAGQRARTAPLRQAVQRIEQRLATLVDERGLTEAALADPSLYEGEASPRLAELTRRAAELAAEVATLEEQWLHAHAELEQAGGN
jgi:ATP-binding cassette subfamily F protein 3